jgi:hypothetical protein
MLGVKTDLAALVAGAEECFHLAGSSDAVAATRSVRATVVRLSPHLLALATASDAVVTAVDVLDQTSDLTAAARTKRITPRMMHAYRLMSRTANGRSGTRLHRSRRLFQQLCVDMAAQIEGNRLSWLRNNQDKLRADSYKGLTDSIRRNDVLENTGKKVILPSSHMGSDRYMQQLFQDAMAIVREMGKPHLFITVTCNPNWKEIIDEVKATGGTIQDRPDVVARVFHLKLKAIEACWLSTETPCQVRTHHGLVKAQVSGVKTAKQCILDALRRRQPLHQHRPTVWRS